MGIYCYMGFCGPCLVSTPTEIALTARLGTFLCLEGAVRDAIRFWNVFLGGIHFVALLERSGKSSFRAFPVAGPALVGTNLIGQLGEIKAICCYEATVGLVVPLAVEWSLARSLAIAGKRSCPQSDRVTRRRREQAARRDEKRPCEPWSRRRSFIF